MLQDLFLRRAPQRAWLTASPPTDSATEHQPHPGQPGGNKEGTENVSHQGEPGGNKHGALRRRGSPRSVAASNFALPDFSEGDPVEIWAAAAKATAWLSSSEEAWLNAHALVLHLLQATGTSYLVSLRVVAAFSTTELVRIVNPGDQDFTSLMEHKIKKNWLKGGSRSRRRDRPRSVVVLGV